MFHRKHYVMHVQRILTGNETSRQQQSCTRTGMPQELSWIMYLACPECSSRVHQTNDPHLSFVSMHFQKNSNTHSCQRCRRQCTPIARYKLHMLASVYIESAWSQIRVVSFNHVIESVVGFSASALIKQTPGGSTSWLHLADQLEQVLSMKLLGRYFFTYFHTSPRNSMNSSWIVETIRPMWKQIPSCWHKKALPQDGRFDVTDLIQIPIDDKITFQHGCDCDIQSNTSESLEEHIFFSGIVADENDDDTISDQSRCPIRSYDSDLHSHRSCHEYDVLHTMESTHDSDDYSEELDTRPSRNWDFQSPALSLCTLGDFLSQMALSQRTHVGTTNKGRTSDENEYPSETQELIETLFRDLDLHEEYL